MKIKELLERVIVQNEMVIRQNMELLLVQCRGCNWIFFEQDNLISSLSAWPILGAKNVGVRDVKMDFINHIPVSHHGTLCVRSLRGRLLRRRVVFGAIRENYGGNPCLKVY